MKSRDLRLDTDLNFILSQKHGNDLEKLMNEYPDGVPDAIICKVLDISPSDLKSTYESAIVKLRKAFNEPVE